MLGYVLRRLMLAVPVLAGATIIAFILGVVAPGDPVADALAQNGFDSPTPQEIEAMRVALGLDRPLPVQYMDWLGGVVRGDLGRSIFTDLPIAQEFARRVPVTLSLAVCAVILAVVFGVPLGMAMGYWHNRAFDHVSRFITLTLLSVPGFWLALMLIFVFSETLRWLPTSGLGDWRHLVLSSAVLATGMAAVLMRLGRAVMLEVMSESYIIAARGRGLTEARVVIGHALKNMAAPLITITGAYFGGILGGAVIVEVIFALPGIGQYAVEGIFRRDYPVIQGYVLFTAAIFVLFNLLADLACLLVNPQLRPGQRAAA